MVNTDNKTTMRLARFLARSGVASRRKSEELIVAGRVQVNDKATTVPATKINPQVDCVKVDGCSVVTEAPRYYVLNKPPGYTCSTSDRHAAKLISELFPDNSARLFTVGRLDRDSEGLIICTNDGDFAQQIAHPSYEIPKTYHVEIQGHVTSDALNALKRGIVQDGERLQAERAGILKQAKQKTILEIVLNEGKKREIRRMCKACGWKVKRLRRVAIGPLELGDLKPGASRPLTRSERDAFMHS